MVGYQTLKYSKCDPFEIDGEEITSNGAKHEALAATHKVIVCFAAQFLHQLRTSAKSGEHTR
jgi:hypothetical protein